MGQGLKDQIEQIRIGENSPKLPRSSPRLGVKKAQKVTVLGAHIKNKGSLDRGSQEADASVQEDKCMGLILII